MMSLYKPSPKRSQRLEKIKGKTSNNNKHVNVKNQLTEPVSPFDELMRYHHHESDEIKEAVEVFNDVNKTTCSTTTIATRKTKSFSPSSVYLEYKQNAKESRHYDNVNDDDIEGRDPDHDFSRSEFASDMSRHDRDGGREGGGGGGGGGENLHQHYPQYGHLQHLYISNEKKKNNHRRRCCEDRSKRYNRRHHHHHNHESDKRQDPQQHRQKMSDNKKSGKSATNLHHKPSQDDPHQVPVVITVPGIIESTESKDTSEVSLDDTLWTTTTKKKNGKTKPNSNSLVKSSKPGRMLKNNVAVSKNENNNELFTLVSSSSQKLLSFDDTRDDNDEDMSNLFDYPDPPLDVPFMKVTIINDFWPSDEEDLDVPSPRKKDYSSK